MNEDLKPIESISIRDVHATTAYLYFKTLPPEKRQEEDLNDKKMAWLMVATKVGRKNLSERDKKFYDQYIKEGLKFSMYYNFKPEIMQFIEQQEIRYGVKK